MHAVENPKAGQTRLPQLVCLTNAQSAPVASRRNGARRLAAGLSGLAHAFARLLSGWRERRRARRRLESWLTIDPRLLADIGLRPDEVRAVAQGDIPASHLADRGGRWLPGHGRTTTAAAPLRLVGGDDLDAAA